MVPAPPAPCARGHEKEQCKKKGETLAAFLPGLGAAFARRRRPLGNLWVIVGGLRIFGHQRFFIQAEITRDGAQETAVEDAAGQILPALAFQRFEETGSDAGGLGDFVQRDATHLAFAPQVLAERALGHRGRAAE